MLSKLSSSSSSLIPRKYYRRLHRFMEKSVYGTLGLYRDYRFFSRSRLVLALALVAIVLSSRFLIFYFLRVELPLILFLVATTIAAWLGGFRTAVAVVALSILSELIFVGIMGDGISTSFLAWTAVFIFEALIISFFITSVAQARRFIDFNVNQLKSKEKYLTEVNTYVTNLLESLDDGFITCDHGFVVTYVNKPMQNLLKKKKQQLVGFSLSSAFPAAFVNKIKKRRAALGPENPALRFEGDLFGRWFLIHLHFLKNSLSIHLDDITARKELEQRKDFFIRAASHELKTPLTSVKLYLEIMERYLQSDDTESVRDYVRRINSQVNKITALINNLLDLSKIQSNQFKLNKEPLYLKDMISETADLFRHISPRHEIVVVEDGEAPVSVVGDKERLAQVLMNLISNAIKYSPEGGRITLSQTRNGDELLVGVRDQGVGINKKFHTKIFKRFFRVTSGGGDTYSGLGVGLYISYDIIKGHGGKIWVESEEGKGSVFFFTLPLREDLS